MGTKKKPVEGVAIGSFEIEPAEALLVIREMLVPRAGRTIYQVRGVEVTKDQCLDALEAFVQPRKKVRR